MANRVGLAYNNLAKGYLKILAKGHLKMRTLRLTLMVVYIRLHTLHTLPNVANVTNDRVVSFRELVASFLNMKRIVAVSSSSFFLVLAFLLH